jgi:ketosteroid isomerase-like protein
MRVSDGIRTHDRLDHNSTERVVGGCTQALSGTASCFKRIRRTRQFRTLLLGDTARAMSQENLETVKEFTRLFEAGDRTSWREYFDPNVIWDTSESSLPSAGVYHGHQGVERFFREWAGAWSDLRFETREYIEAGDSVIVVLHQSGIGRGSGVRAERDFFGVYDLRDSKVVRYRQYESRKAALEAAGLQE